MGCVGNSNGERLILAMFDFGNGALAISGSTGDGLVPDV
jgi:hypothetical protein